MTWTRDDCPGHEGALIGLIAIPPGEAPARFGDRFRELAAADAGPRYLDAVQVGCICGWRSARLDAPIDCRWSGTGLDTSEWFDARTRSIWRSHAIATVFADQEAARVGTSR